MSVIGVAKNDLKPWLLMKVEDNIILFGRIIDDSSLTYNSSTTQLNSYSNEDDLESIVDNLAGEFNYYKRQAEYVNTGLGGQEKYLGTSLKYPPIEPEPPSPEIE